MRDLNVTGEGETWRCEWRYGADSVAAWLNDLRRPDAEQLLEKWQAGAVGGILDCRSCPIGFAPDCSHGTFLYLFTEMTAMRIMPMRAAL